MNNIFLKLVIISGTIFFLIGCKNQGSISDISKDACDKWFDSELEKIHKDFDKNIITEKRKHELEFSAGRILMNCKTILFNRQRAKGKGNVATNIQPIDTTRREEIINNENFNDNLMSVIEEKASKMDPENNMGSKEVEVTFTISRNNSGCPTDMGCKLIKIGKNSNCLCPPPRP